MQQLTRHIYSELEESWKLLLADQFSSDYFLLLESFLNKENEGYPVFPPEGLIFRAFEATPFSKVKVVMELDKRMGFPFQFRKELRRLPHCAIFLKS